MESETSNHLYEVDFLTSVGDKICPIEVKSGNYRTHRSLDVFCDKFSRRVKDKYVVHTKDYKWDKLYSSVHGTVFISNELLWLFSEYRYLASDDFRPSQNISYEKLNAWCP